ncbi:MAG: amidohydrolase family protein [Armatimonadetes bacterium]|nr:amidohydrolase family protein [Armatimonadota bacterium]
MSLKDELVAQMREGPVIDTHEHIAPRDPKAYDGLFALWQFSYVGSHFGAAGMPAEVWSMAAEDEAKAWQAVRPYLDRVGNTAYYRNLLLACRELYGLEDEDISDDNWQSLSETIRAKGQQEGWGEEVFRRAGVRKALEDTYWSPLPDEMPLGGDVLARVLRINMFVTAPLRGMTDHNGNSPYDFEERFGLKVLRLSDYLDLIEAVLQWNLERGVVAIKSALAYDRELFFEDVPREDAETIFDLGDQRPHAVKALGDFIMHHILGRAQAVGLPVQIHTGYLAGGGYLQGRDPKALTNLITKFSDVRFDLFHGGYPYAGELAFLGAHYRNVYVDLCWLPLISPTATRQYLHEWIDQVPMSKILWGGDCLRVDAAYAAVRYAQEVVAGALEAKVAEGYMPDTMAFELAKRIFHDNAAELFFGE